MRDCAQVTKDEMCTSATVNFSVKDVGERKILQTGAHIYRRNPPIHTDSDRHSVIQKQSLPIQ
jgi:hypothetical protein